MIIPILVIVRCPVVVLIVLVFLLLVDTYRRGARANSISFELEALGVLWVVWLSNAAFMANQDGNCGELFFSFQDAFFRMTHIDDTYPELCGLYGAMGGFAFITWAIRALICFFCSDTRHFELTGRIVHVHQ